MNKEEISKKVNEGIKSTNKLSISLFDKGLKKFKDSSFNVKLIVILFVLFAVIIEPLVLVPLAVLLIMVLMPEKSSKKIEKKKTKGKESEKTGE